MAWVRGATDAQVRGVGAVEVLGAIGVVHRRSRDPLPMVLPAAVQGVLAVVLAVGRFSPEAF